MPATAHQASVKNRRKFVRIPSHCKVSAQKIHFSAKGDTESWGEIRNIGAGGILFTSEKQHQCDELCKVTITLPMWKKHHPEYFRADEDDVNSPLTAVCQVTRSVPLPNNTFEIAAKFVNIYDDDLVGLQEFIDTEAERLGIPGK